MSRITQTKHQWCEGCRHKGWVIAPSAILSQARLCECLSNCPACNGYGFERYQNERGYEFIAPCKTCGNIRRNIKLYNSANIPAKYSNVLQVDFFQPKGRSLQQALTYVKAFVKNYPHRRGFLLMGGAGVGKTHLAIAAISELTLEHGVRCMFKDFFYLLSELKEAYTQGLGENEVIEPLIATEVLVIDELGKGRSSDWELNILDQIISKRYNASKITLITTNYVSSAYEDIEGGDVLEERVGERIASRLHEMCEFIYLKGQDYRRTKHGGK